jgi:hypothetical protein
MALDPDQIRRQDAAGVISSLERDLVWTFVNANWDTLFKR